jgi:surface antigen
LIAGLATSSFALNGHALSNGVPSGSEVNARLGAVLPVQSTRVAVVNNPPDVFSCDIQKPEDALDTDLLRERTVIGTVVDESIDRNMDDRDRACIRVLLDHHDDGHELWWKNAEAGISFSILATRSFRSGGGLLCREFSAKSQRGDLTIGAAQRVACRQLSGDWLVRK